MSSNFESYTVWCKRVTELTERKARIERAIEQEAERTLRSRRTLVNTTAEHLANGAKAKDDRLHDLDKKIDRAVARATMYGLGMIFDAVKQLQPLT